MAINPAALKAYGQAAAVANAPTGGGDVAAADFGSMLTKAVADTEGQLRAAETAAAQSVTGEAPIIDVVTAVSAAEMTLETVVAVRDEVVRAYQEILRMPI